MDIDRDPEWYGRVFECVIGSALSRMSGNLFYWRDGPNEVDFVLEQGKRLYAIEVKSGRRRTSRGLQVFLKKYPRAVPVTIQRDEGERLLKTGDLSSILPVR